MLTGGLWERGNVGSEGISRPNKPGTPISAGETSYAGRERPEPRGG